MIVEALSADAGHFEESELVSEICSNNIFNQEMFKGKSLEGLNKFSLKFQEMKQLHKY